LYLLVHLSHPILGRDKKKLEKSAQADTSTSAPGAGSGELPTAEILAAMNRIKDDRIPTTPEEREKYFMAQVEKGEQLCASGACTYLGL
jgi:import receptor subunit TOM20